MTFYTTCGHLDDGSWSIPMKIRVHEEPDAATSGPPGTWPVAETLRTEDATPDEEDRYVQRVYGFIADSESGERVRFQFDDDPDKRSYRLLAADGSTGTDRNGLIGGRLSLTAERARILLEAQGSTHGWLSFHAVSHGHAGRGRLRLIASAGVSVISDVDDTVKVTNIPAGHAENIANTFFREFVAAPCMAEMYRDFGEDVALHYVSGSPWQLYEPLSGFLLADPPGFPAGSFHMKNVRTNFSDTDSYSDIWKLVAGGSQQATFDQKIEQIGTLLSHFPERTFVLIGDSGEQAPEVFAALRERFRGRSRRSASAT